MIDFYEKIDYMGLYDILLPAEYIKPDFKGLPKVLRFMRDAIESNAKVLFYGDYDVDGLMCALILSEGMRYLGLEHYDIFQYRSRTHSLDRMAVQQCLQGDYDYFIIGDTGFGASDFEQIVNIAESGTKVIILDHHESGYVYDDFPDNVAAINTTIEKDNAPDAYNLSAGALSFAVIDALSEFMGQPTKESLAAYATISLFADCMDMRSKINRAIYFRAKKLDKSDLPRKVRMFMNSYTAFNARFIGFWFSPRVNAVFRSEHLQLLNVLFLQRGILASTESRTLQMIDEVYKESRALIAKVVDIIDVIELNHFVFADINSVDKHIGIKENKLYNYTGLVANQLAERYDKTAVVICQKDSVYKGSVRDIYGRNYLSIFKKICDAGGHNPAFGFFVPILAKSEFFDAIQRIDSMFAIERIENKPVIIDYEYNTIDSALVEDMASYNEFAGPRIPIFLLRKQIIGGIREQHSMYYYCYDWQGYTIQSNRQLDFGSYVLLRPFKSGRTKLLVQ